ncbi:DUF1493 family protein [Psychromonas sp. PT13]|uniref:DUF1493 family protein n=1 Tax=Psychromonas sp. PT13 TaxID=3439547 RepID=UPI003EB8EB4A
MEDIFNRITTMIEFETGYSKNKITRSTRLYQDINIDGDDAEELLYKYSELFGIDMSDFEFCRYFNNEGFDSISILKSLFGAGNKRNLEPITVDMLEKNALSHKWNY